jgi:hypothetical protein
MNKLFFGIGNAKLSAAVATFSLPAGFTCPFAKECLSQSDRITGKITDGPDCRFRCSAATGEARCPNVRTSRWGNFEFLKSVKTVDNMSDLIYRSIPWGIPYVRIGVSGDFFSENYFKAWINVANAIPTTIFYGYTKSLPYLVKHRKDMPSNFRLVASKGGTHDHLIKKHNLPYAEVVFSDEEAASKGLEIDHDDSHAIKADKTFALRLHGGQPKGTPAAIAWSKIMRTVGGYSRKRKKMLVTS